MSKSCVCPNCGSKCTKSGKPKGLPKPSEPDLVAAISHVVYEYATLHSSFRLLDAGGQAKGVFPAAFDSFLLHCRSLVEFFQTAADRERRKKDDLRAEHYAPGWITPNLPTLDRWQSRIHILLAHLSTRMNVIHADKSGLNHSTHLRDMLAEIDGAWSLFMARIKTIPKFEVEYSEQLREKGMPAL